MADATWGDDHRGAEPGDDHRADELQEEVTRVRRILNRALRRDVEAESRDRAAERRDVDADARPNADPDAASDRAQSGLDRSASGVDRDHAAEDRYDLRAGSRHDREERSDGPPPEALPDS